MMDKLINANGTGHKISNITPGLAFINAVCMPT